MLKIALSGKIGSGKSTFGSYLASCGGFVIEVDDILQLLLKKDAQLLRELQANFGDQISNEGIFSEQKSCKLFMDDAAAIKRFHSITNPYIEAAIGLKFKEAQAQRAPYFVLVSPEISNRNRWGLKVFDYSVHINCSDEKQFTRLQSRSHKDSLRINKLLTFKSASTQSDFDYEIVNNFNLDHLQSCAYALHKKLINPQKSYLFSCYKAVLIGSIFSGTLAHAGIFISCILNCPSTANSQQSVINTSAALQNTLALQNAVLANSFNYDCNLFGANNVCVSAGGRNTAVQAANGLNNTSGLLITAYRPHPNYRIGAYADQNLSVSNQGGTVSLGNNTPLIGLFGAWHQKLDGTGPEVKVSAAYGQKNTTTNRGVVGSGVTASEAGSGSSTLNSQGAQVTAKYGFALTDKAIISPYIGMRYTQNNMNAYTEGASLTVTAPLTYSPLNTNATSALAGVGGSYKVIPTVTTFASAGVETDTNTTNGSYSGTSSSILGLTPVNFNANLVKTRPTATLGAYLDIAKNQRLGITGIYRQEAYQAVSTTTVMATYTVGL